MTTTTPASDTTPAPFVRSIIPPTLLATVVGALAAALVAGCGASRKDIDAARSSGYDADFATVYDVALNAIREHYPRLEENAVTGVIKTAWHPVHSLTAADDPYQSDRPVKANNPMMQGRGERVRKVYFIRFQVYVVGGKPWRVRVDGQASEWSEGGVPSPLHGAAVPPWLAGRVDAMRVRIHNKLKKYAVPLPATDEVASEDDAVKDAPVVVDQSRLGGLPEQATEAVVIALGAAKQRDFNTLESVMHPEFVWSLGAPPSAQSAIVMWQADSGLLTRLAAILEAGCTLESSGERLTCPPSATHNDYRGHRATFARGSDGTWRMTSFVTGD